MNTTENPTTRPVGFNEKGVKNVLSGKRAAHHLTSLFTFSRTAQGHNYWWDVASGGVLNAEARANLEALLELPSAPFLVTDEDD